MSGSSVFKQAITEIAREKAKFRKSPPPSHLEEMPYRDEVRGKKPEEKLLPISPPLKEMSSTRMSSVEPSYASVQTLPSSAAFPWKDFRPMGEPKKKKPRSVNTVTLFVIARKMIGAEWKKAKGNTKSSSQIQMEKLEREAKQYRLIEDEQRREQEKAQLKYDKYKKDLEKILFDVADKLMEEQDEMNLEKANKVVENNFGNVGRLYNLDWKDNGLDVWIEPWDEKWARQKRGITTPSLFHLRMNDKLQIDSIKVVEEKEVVLKQQKKRIERELGTSMEKEETRGLRDDEISKLVEKKLNDIGRVIFLKRLQDDRWISSLEPWEEIRQRNISGSTDPVGTTQIEVNYSREKGRFSFVPYTKK